MVLAPEITQAAAGYEAYVTSVAAIKANFQSGADVAAALRAGESYDPQALLRGQMAFAAVAALQDPAFVAEVRAFAANPARRQEMIQALSADDNYATAFRHAPTAAGLAEGALMQEAQALQISGAAVKQSAYDMQHQPWSLAPVADRDGRLAAAKAVADDAPVATVDQTDRMSHAADGSAPLPFTGAPVAPAPYPTVVARGLDIAALALLGAAGAERVSLNGPVFSDDRDKACLSMARLNLYQCLSVARPNYEDAFCLGQHAMMDTAQCLEIADGMPAPTVAPLAASTTETPYAKPAKPTKHRKAKAKS